MKTLLRCAVILLILAPAAAFAKLPRPTAVLVMLRVESRKIAYFQKTGQTAEKEYVLHDAREARQAMIHDFTDHFNFCPVYYFMDTNYSKVINGDFQGVLLNKDLRPIVLSPITPGDTSFLIVAYGYKTESKNPDDYRGTATVTAGLVITNYKGEDINNLRTYIPKKLDLFNRVTKYRFSSKNTEISYFDLAETFNGVLHRRF